MHELIVLVASGEQRLCLYRMYVLVLIVIRAYIKVPGACASTLARRAMPC